MRPASGRGCGSTMQVLSHGGAQPNPIRRRIILLVLLIVVAAVLRFTLLEQHDIIDDEASYLLRGIGYFDYDPSDTARGPTQVFPIQQWWQSLSFTDHPPVVFFTTHVFFALFGVSAFVARLPFALGGLASVFLMYAVGKKLLGEHFGFLAAGVLAFDNFHLWFSRVGFTEAIQIFFKPLPTKSRGFGISRSDPNARRYGATTQWSFWTSVWIFSPSVGSSTGGRFTMSSRSFS